MWRNVKYALLAAGVVSCSAAETSSPAGPQVDRIVVSPAFRSVAVGQSAAYSVTAYNSTGGVVSAPDISWTLAPSDAGTITSNGVVTLGGIAAATVRAVVGSMSAEARIMAPPTGSYRLTSVNGFPLPHTFLGAACPSRFAVRTGDLVIRDGVLAFSADTIVGIFVGATQLCGNVGYGGVGLSGVLKMDGRSLQVTGAPAGASSNVTSTVSALNINAAHASLRLVQSDIPFQFDLVFASP